MERIIECVPNFSEGRDPDIIRQISDAAKSAGARVLDVDPGAATNRCVITIAGAPDDVIEAAVRAASKAKELIDMRQHSGEHPRFGALDVCPLVPIAGVTMEETVDYARELGRRLGDEVGLTVFLYEHAATRPERRNLAAVRAGEYEGLAAKLADPEWQPDFGPARFDPRSGATAVGARDFLIAYNVNLNSTSTRRANAIAFDVREKGRPARDGDPLTGPIRKGPQGEDLWIAGTLKSVKAIGWFIEEYGIAQISMNLTNLSVTPLHVAFDEVCDKARARGIRVTGSEIVGLVPLAAMLDAGRYFLHKQQRSSGVADRELLRIAIKSMGLDDLGPFDPDRKIIEYVLAAEQRGQRLVDLRVTDFVDTTASESPAPGGGSVAALLGALGAALATMVANLSSHRRGWDARWREFSDLAEEGKARQAELLRLVDADTAAFDAVMAALGMPKRDEAERAARNAALQQATLHAAEVPLQTMEVARRSFTVIRTIAETGMSASVSDAGVAALCARTAVLAAGLNVRINAAQLDDDAQRARLLTRASELETDALQQESTVLEIVATRM